MGFKTDPLVWELDNGEVVPCTVRKAGPPVPTLFWENRLTQ